MDLVIPETEIQAFLSGIESGVVRLTPLDEPQNVYAGVVQYAASNGWRVAAFNDCNEWITSSGSRRREAREMVLARRTTVPSPELYKIPPPR